MLTHMRWWLVLVAPCLLSLGIGCTTPLPEARCVLTLGLACTPTLPGAPLVPPGGLPSGSVSGQCPKGGCPALEPEYRIGSGDELQVVVWRNESLSVRAPVRPDGMISLPLIGDLRAANKTPRQLSREIERQLANVVNRPQVTVIVTEFVGNLEHQVRVVGEAVQPKALTYRHDMTVLDVMIAVGGLTRFADGNRSILVRTENGEQITYRVRLGDLLLDGDTSANAYLLPGDILIIPETLF
jgi:polysaccharide export outer membrane protein